MTGFSPRQRFEFLFKSQYKPGVENFYPFQEQRKLAFYWFFETTLVQKEKCGTILKVTTEKNGKP